MNIAWGITGAGHYLEESIKLIAALNVAGPPVKIDVFLSLAAEEVIRMYHVEDALHRAANSVIRDTMSSAPIVGRFARARYRVLVVAPATSNSVAKFVWGISDSLITTLFAQAGKSRVPAIVLPTDIAPEMDSLTPSGSTIKVYPRPIDLENTARLGEFEDVTLVTEVKELEQCLNTFLSPAN
jgi:dihydromethanopterin reductase (acceptor)